MKIKLLQDAFYVPQYRNEILECTITDIKNKYLIQVIDIKNREKFIGILNQNLFLTREQARIKAIEQINKQISKYDAEIKRIKEDIKGLEVLKSSYIYGEDFISPESCNDL